MQITNVFIFILVCYAVFVMLLYIISEVVESYIFPQSSNVALMASGSLLHCLLAVCVTISLAALLWWYVIPVTFIEQCVYYKSAKWVM